MNAVLNFIREPWPWYVAGPLIGLCVPLLLVVSNKALGVSSNFRHICAACFPANVDYFKYDWKAESWNLFLVAGILLGGFISIQIIGHPDTIAISDATVKDLAAFGITDREGFVPRQIFNFQNLATPSGLLFMVLGGFLIGFGTRYANGCTSGHSITGLSNLQWVSLVATVSFFAGGLLVTHLLYPLIF
jgi:uncharacterized membrane protein YedE/YeeE